MESQSKEKNESEEDEDEKLKLSLMSNFVKDNKDIHARISGAIESGDIKLANRLAHTLKSNAGILGKTALQKISGDIEDLLKDGKSLVKPEHLNLLEAELTAVLNEIEPLVKANVPQVRIEPIDAEKTRALFEELKPLLESGTPDSLKFIEALFGVPGSEKLIELIEDFDFEEAYKLLVEKMNA
jgi:HPt (histidine-containing phosphotransfer) domain-containing protein